MTPTPPSGTPVPGDQAAYDADQDARIRAARRYASAAVGIALASLVGAAVAIAHAAPDVRAPAARRPVVHVGCPAAPACPPCAACPACPQSPERHHR